MFVYPICGSGLLSVIPSEQHPLKGLIDKLRGRDLKMLITEGRKEWGTAWVVGARWNSGGSIVALPRDAHGWGLCPCVREEPSPSSKNTVDDVVPNGKEQALSKSERGFCVL